MGSTIQNPQLHDMLQQWLVTALPLLRTNWIVLKEAHDPMLVSMWIFGSDPGISELSQTKALTQAVAQIPEFIYQDASVVPNYDGATDENAWQARSVIADVALEYLREEGSDEFEPELFATLYSDLEQYLHRFDDIRIRMTIELWNVRSEATPIELPSGIVIRPLSEDEQVQSREARKNSFPFLPGSDEPQISIPDLLIEFDRSAANWALLKEVPKLLVLRISSSYQGRTIGDRVLLSLRLLHESVIWLGHGWTFPGNRFLRSESEIRMGRDRSWQSQFDDPYSRGEELRSDTSAYLTKDQIRRLANVYSFIDSRRKVRKSLDVPLRRFEMSFNRTAPVERFIDHWTALEALFSPGFQESSYRMHQFMAQFVGRDPRDRWDIYSKAKAAYKVRNDVLHGRRFLSSEELNRHAAPIEDYVRRSLINCIGDLRMPDHDELEREIFLQGASAHPE
jgi:hypothetical protein